MPGYARTNRRKVSPIAILLALSSLSVISLTLPAEPIDHVSGQPIAATPLDNAALERLISRAEAGAAGAQLELGMRYLRGDGLAQSYRQAAHWLQAASSRGVAAAQMALAELYRTGLGVPQDTLEAERLTALASASQRLPQSAVNNEPTAVQSTSAPASIPPQRANEKEVEVRTPQPPAEPDPAESAVADMPLVGSPTSTPRADTTTPTDDLAADSAKPEPMAAKAEIISEARREAIHHTLAPTHHFGEQHGTGSALLQQVSPFTRNPAPLNTSPDPTHAATTTATGTYRWVGSHQAFLHIAPDNHSDISLDIDAYDQADGEQLFSIQALSISDDATTPDKISVPRHVNLTAEFP